jgi:hypothetical protein
MKENSCFVSQNILNKDRNLLLEQAFDLAYSYYYSIPIPSPLLASELTCYFSSGFKIKLGTTIKCVVVGRPTIAAPFLLFWCKKCIPEFILFMQKRKNNNNIQHTWYTPTHNNTNGTGSHIFHLLDILGVESITWTLGDAHLGIYVVAT